MLVPWRDEVFIEGDATDSNTLLRAGVEKAAGLFAVSSAPMLSTTVISRPTKTEIMRVRLAWFFRGRLPKIWIVGSLLLLAVSWASSPDHSVEASAFFPLGITVGLLPLALAVGGILGPDIRDLCERGYRYTFSESGIEAVTRLATVHLQWPAINSVWTLGQILVVATRGSLIILPSRCFDQDRDFDSVRELAMRKVPASRR